MNRVSLQKLQLLNGSVTTIVLQRLCHGLNQTYGINGSATLLLNDLYCICFFVVVGGVKQITANL